MLSKSRKEDFQSLLVYTFCDNIRRPRKSYAADYISLQKKLFSSVAFEVRFITTLPCDCVIWFMHDWQVISSMTAKLVQACMLGSKATKPQLVFSELFIMLYFG